MLLCNIRFCENLPEEYKVCIDFIKKSDVRSISAGRYDLPGGGYVNVCEYQTAAEDKCVKEAHRKYIDVHYMVAGTEIAKQAFLNDITTAYYKEDEDFVAVSGVFYNSFLLKEGDIFIAYPEDAHLTRVAYGEPATVKKLIFKIPV
ncbi:MAG: YhcH/YjgK/YiaL family protein [Clostridia bacterium]|nr:YhcH/YjgK/YiaL family protein [Clostridia bacterium]